MSAFLCFVIIIIIAAISSSDINSL